MFFAQNEATRPNNAGFQWLSGHFIWPPACFNWNQKAKDSNWKPSVNLTPVDAQSRNLSAPSLFIPEKQREDRGPLSSQMQHLGLTDADPAWSSRMRLLSPYLGQMLHDRHSLKTMRGHNRVMTSGMCNFPPHVSGNTRLSWVYFQENMLYYSGVF